MWTHGVGGELSEKRSSRCGSPSSGWFDLHGQVVLHQGGLIYMDRWSFIRVV